MSLTLKSVLTAGLLLLGFQAAAQDIPQAFQGKWTGRYEGKVSPKHVRALCAMGYDANEKELNTAMRNVDLSEDSGFYIEIGKKSIELKGWEWGAKYTKLNYRIYSADKIVGTARVREEEPEQGTQIYNDNFEFSLNRGVLTQRFRDFSTDGSGKKVWRTRTLMRCK